MPCIKPVRTVKNKKYNRRGALVIIILVQQICATAISCVYYTVYISHVTRPRMLFYNKLGHKKK